MKRIVVTIIMTMFACSIYASVRGMDGPRAINYKEVISQIEYPRVCREKGIEGKVLVKISVDRDGKVEGYEIKSAPCKEFEIAVEKVIDQLMFFPATNLRGELSEGEIVLPFHFKLTI